MGIELKKDSETNYLKIISIGFATILFFLAIINSSKAIIHTVDVPRTLQESQDFNYELMNTNRYFTVYYGDDPSSGNVVKFISGGVEMTLLPMALNWNNDYSQLQQISMPQSVSGTGSGSDIVYEDAYGSGIDLIYETQQDKVKEKLVINSRSDLTDPAQYVIDGGNVVLELGFQFTSNGKIFVQGAEWDGSEAVVEDDLVVTDSDGIPVYSLPRPFATDSLGSIVYGHYVLKTTAQKLYIRAYIPYSWLNDVSRAYPVTIDPTFIVDYSPIPAEHLVTGNYIYESDFEYNSIFDITTEMSDFNTSTYKETFMNTMPFNTFLINAVKFELTSGNISIDYGLNKSNVVHYNSPNLNVGGILGSGIDYDGVNDYSVIQRKVDLSASDDRVVCLSIYNGGVGSTEYIYDNKGGGNDRGMELRMTASDTVDFFVRRGAVQTTLSGTVATDDSTWHTVCGVSLANGTVQLWTDGVKDVQSTGITGVMDSTQDIYIATAHTIGSYYSQKLDEVCVWKGQDIDEQQIIADYEINYCGDPDGTHISGSWNITYDSNYQWYLGFRKITNGGINTFTVTAYDDEEKISGQYVTDTFSGTGEFHILINKLMDYMTNTKGLSFTKLRFTSNNAQNISEIFLVQEGNDTIYPSINDCFVNATSLGCSETARMSCNITDDFALNEVIYQIDSTNHTIMTKNEDKWQYDFSPTGYLNETYIWEYVYAIDYADNKNTSFVNISIDYYCEEPCVEDWQQDTIICRVNDTYIITYTDQNACGTFDDLPLNNGTEDFCNYCSADLVQVLGECLPSGIQNVTYYDNNYYSCCFVTNQTSDCLVETYPYNETTTQECVYFSDDMGEPDCPSEFDFKQEEREYCVVRIPQNYSNETFKCISYIKDDNDEIVQVNPEYKERAETLLDFLRGEPESREYFSPANKLVNIYITKKNLLPEYDYYLYIECSSDQRDLVSVHPFTIGYEGFENVFFRTRWLYANAGYIIAGIIVMFFILAVLIMVYNGVFG